MTKDVTNPHRERQKFQSLSVAPSPFNSIKLELAIIVIFGGLLLLALDSITDDLILQISVLFIAGSLGMAWIMWRTRMLLQSHRKAASAAKPPTADGDRRNIGLKHEP